MEELSQPGGYLEFARRDLASFRDDARVECENRERNDSEHAELGHPRPHRPHGQHAAFRQLRPYRALAEFRIELPKVGLDGV